MLNLFLLMLQVVPIVGTLPLMCLVNFRVFSGAVRRQATLLEAPAGA